MLSTASAEVIDKGAGQDAHEAGQDNDVRLILIQRLDQRRVIEVSLRIILVADAFDRDVGIARALESGSIRAVTQHH